MMNVCVNCGEYRADKTIDSSGPCALCPVCGHAHRFLQLPLLIVAGASGTGKSTVCHALLASASEAVLLDGDILWRPEFNRPRDNYRDFFETWLRVAKGISQSGRPVVLFNAGMGVPENIERCVERRYFADVHYLALVCDDEVLEQRLRARPAWRKSGAPENVEEQLRFNRWFKEKARHGPFAVELLDTTGIYVEETTEQVATWIQSKLSATATQAPVT